MKERYIRPTIVGTQAVDSEGIVPLAVVGPAIGPAAALLAGFAAGRAVASAMKANPVSKIPNIKAYNN